MAWKIKLSEQAVKSLAKLDKQIAKRITTKLREVATLDNPRSSGKALTGNLSGLWRYRIGDYRVVCDIEDNILVILVIDIEHRSRVYKHVR